jgi:hypothetical protein
MKFCVWLMPLVLLVAGCSANEGCRSSTGWRFEMGNPGVLTAPVAFRQRDGGLELQPLSLREQTLSGFAAPLSSCSASQTMTLPPPTPLAVDPCVLQAILHRLDEIAARMPPAK